MDTENTFKRFSECIFQINNIFFDCREVVRSPMVEAQCLVQICFPVELKNGTMVEEIHFVGFLSKLLETKIMQVLRFKHGQIYSVGVSVFLGGNKPSRTGIVRGDISINFSCDPEISSKLASLLHM